MSDKKTYTFTIKLEGDVRGKVKPSDVAEFIRDFEAAFLAKAKADGIDNVLASDIPLFLESVTTGSVNIKYSSENKDLVACSVVDTLEAVRRNEVSRLPTEVKKKLIGITERANKFGLRVVAPSNSSLGIKRTVFESAMTFKEPLRIVQQCTLYGTVVSAGGGEPHATIKLFNKPLSVRADGNREQIKELGSLLYQEVGLSGFATIIAEGTPQAWIYEKIQISAVLKYRESNIMEAVEALSLASNGRWDNIDPKKYVKDLRDGGDE